MAPLGNQVKYPFATRPYQHQLKALRQLWRRGWGGALLWEPGTGKTKCALDFAGALYLYRGLRRVLVICPIAAFGVWVAELGKHMPEQVPFTVTVLNKSRSAEDLHFDKPPDDVLWVVVVNYETAWRIFPQLRWWKPQLCIIDESHQIKRGSTKKARGCHKLGLLASYRLILTGTPVTNSPLDLFSQWKFLNPVRFGRSFRDFAAAYAVFGGYGGHEVLLYKNLDQLREIIEMDASIIKKEDCLDLPEKVYEVIPIDLDSETAEVYRQMEDQMVAELESGELITAEIILTKLLRLSQITSGFTSRSNNGARETIPLGEEKLGALEELVDTYALESQQKVVIFCRFIPSLERIASLLKKKKVPFRVISGDVAYPKRNEAVQWMWSGEGPKVLLAQIATAGLAIDLSCCHTAIYYELDYSLDHYIQSQDRLHRIGQVHKVLYLHLLARESVDEDVYRALTDKKDVAERVVGRLSPGARVVSRR